MSQSLILSHYEGKKYEKISAGRRRGILALLGDFSGKHILDVGCANGALGEILKKISPCEITGIDVSSAAGEEARRALDHVYIFDTEVEDAWPKELRNKVFDVIIISEVLEHLFAPEHLLMQLRRSSDTQTTIIITVPNILFWKNRLRIFLGHFEYEERGLMDRGHIHFFSWNSLRSLVTESGFILDSVAHHVPTRGTRLLSGWFPGLFAQNFIIKIIRKT